MKRIVSPLLAALVLLAAAASPADEPRPDASIGKSIPNFALHDIQGREHSLERLADSKLVVVAFVGTECPLVRLYTRRLVELAAEFGPRGVAFLGIDSNRQDSMREIESYVRQFGVTFPVLRDPGNKVADLFEAQRTPEVFVLDSQRSVRYRGRIDDQYGFRDNVNFQRTQPTRNDLAQAIEELLADRPVSAPRTEAQGCLIGRSLPPNPNSSVTWSNQISRIFQRRCQDCHRPGDIGPFPLLTYDDVAGWDQMIDEVVSQGRMPPWHANPRYGEFINDARLTEEERNLIHQWVRQGAPEGDPADLPPPRVFPSDNYDGEWDQVVYIQDEPFRVPAEGILDYQYFVVDPGFQEDKWIASTAARPGCRAVVHHMAVFIKPPGDFFKLRRQGKVSEIGGYVPGVHFSSYVGHPQDADELPDDGGGGLIHVPAGYEIVFEMHYTASGVEQFDRSGIALKFGDPHAPTRESRQRFMSVLAESVDFAIPPHADSHPVEAWYTFEQDCKLAWMNVHMHLRGKSFRFEALYPDGEREILLDVPRYDFDWQTVYLLKHKKPMPKGTRVRCTAIYDNSADNLRNPDPTRTICYGHQTWEEMMAGTMGIVRDATPAELAQAGLESPSPQTATSDPLVGYLDVEAVQPDKRDVYFYQRALFRKLQGDPAGAVVDLNAALEHNPKLVDALYERGRIRHDAHRFAVAEDDFNQALAVEPDDVKCLVGRGKARFRLENLTGALADFDRAVALDPWDREALYYRSVIRQLKRDVDGALTDLDKLTREVSPRYIAGHWDRAMLLLALGRVDEAMPNLDRCLEQDPDRKPEVDFQLGLAYLRREEPDQAARRFAAVIEQTPRRAEAHVMLGLAYGKQGDAAEEVAHVRQALEIEPNYFAAHFQLARILWTQRDARGALEHLRHCRRIDPSNLDAANLLAWILATHSDPAVRSPAEAIALAEHVCRQSNHQQPGYIDTLAAAYAAAGRYADAIDTATKAIQLGMATRQIALTVNIQERRRLYRDSKPYFESNP